MRLGFKLSVFGKDPFVNLARVAPQATAPAPNFSTVPNLGEWLQNLHVLNLQKFFPPKLGA